MKFPALTFFLLFCANTVFAQTFHPVPDPLLEKEVAFEQANECYIFFDNPSGDTLQLRWRIITTSQPPEWDIDLCDYGLCYDGIPANGTMSPVYDTIQPYLKLIVQPGTTAGAAWLWFRVFEKDHDTNYADVFFSLSTPGTTNTDEPSKAPLLVYPNPASDYLYIENQEDKKHLARLLNSDGRLVWIQTVQPKGFAMVDVLAYSEGFYFLQYGQQVHKILIQK